jgi:UPF0755 protein
VIGADAEIDDRYPATAEQRYDQAASYVPGSAPWVDDPWDDPRALTSAEVDRPPRRSRIVRRVLLLLAALCVVAALVAGSVGWWVLRQVNPSGRRGEPTTFIVKDDDNLVTISHRLKQAGFITHAGVFEWYVKRKGRFSPEPGYYTLRPRDTMGNVAGALRKSPNATFTSVTFPEGYTVAQMARRLSNRLPRLSLQRFLDATTDGQVTSIYLPAGGRSLEGLLFPDTYQVSNGESERQVVARMVRLTERVGRQEGLDDPLLRGSLSPYEVLVIASLIEREARFDSDRPLIARVILNRLELGMPLEIDASLYYGQDPRTPFATLRSLDTPYNTYLHGGLPPTPIANPGRASIRAALNPAVDPSPGDVVCRALPDPTKCRYLYYVISDRAGHHVFAATPEQHAENVRRAREAGLLR